MLTQKILKHFLSYDSKTGIFRWKEQRGRVVKNEVAGSVTNHGYIQIKLLGKMHTAHRLAWLYVYGELPELSIDHINRNKTDNMISNLRIVTKSENAQNTTICSANRSGYKGVSWCKREKKWRACIKLNGKYKSLGYHETKELAYSKYVETANLIHTHNSVFNQ